MEPPIGKRRRLMLARWEEAMARRILSSIGRGGVVAQVRGAFRRVFGPENGPASRSLEGMFIRCFRRELRDRLVTVHVVSPVATRSTWQCHDDETWRTVLHTQRAVFVDAARVVRHTVANWVATGFVAGCVKEGFRRRLAPGINAPRTRV